MFQNICKICSKGGFGHVAKIFLSFQDILWGVLSRPCQDLPQVLAVYLTLRTFLHVLLRLLECKDWRSRKEGVSGLEAWKRGMAGEERQGLEAWAWQLGMGLRHGLEDGLGLRHGLEAWGREG